MEGESEREGESESECERKERELKGKRGNETVYGIGSTQSDFPFFPSLSFHIPLNQPRAK